METNSELQPGETETNTTPSCARCGIPLTNHQFKSNVCADCRQYFIHYPIPFKIKAFGAGVLLLLLFALSSLPDNIKTGIHLKRGKIAAERKAYMTAQNEFAEVVKREPKFIEAQCRLLMAAYHNGDYTTVINTYPSIDGKNIDDVDLFKEVEHTLSAVGRALPSDSFVVFVEAQKTPFDSISTQAYFTYLNQHQDDDYARVRLINNLFNEGSYAAADSMLDGMLSKDPYYHPALHLKVPLKRELLQFDSSHFFINRLLSLNSENVYALSSKVRTLLKEKKDAEALQLAKQCVKKYPQDGHLLSSLAMAYHFNGDAKNRDLILRQAAKDTTNTTSITYASNVITGKEIFRN
jgi:hypothetical protein